MSLVHALEQVLIGMDTQKGRLTNDDLDCLEQAYITPELANQAGLSRVDSHEGARIVGRETRRGDYAGIVIPYYWPGESQPREYRLRRDRPDYKIQADSSLKEDSKYLSPPSSRNLAYFVPGTLPEWLEDTSIPLAIVEGEKKAIALFRLAHHQSCALRFLPVGLAGVWGWKGTVGQVQDEKGANRKVKGVIADFEHIAWTGRTVFIVFDTNVLTNDSVRSARNELAKEVRRRGATVRFVDLPQIESINGVDDLLGLRGPDYVLALFETAKLHSEDKSSRRPQTTVLVELAADVELFRTPEDEVYATVKVSEHFETWPLKSRGFRDWLTYRFYEVVGRSLSTQIYQEALDVLYGRARFGGKIREVHTRIAAHEGALYVDLADNDWRVVQITAEGWSIITSKDSPVRFRRARGMLPLPEPSHGGTLAELRRFVNVRDNADWALLLAWLVASLRPGLPLPLLALYGAQGSTKSTTARVLSSLIDPAKVALRSQPRDERDLMIAARNRWCLTFDNLSHIPGSLSDALCRLATGGGLSTRELYSNDEEILFEALRPVIINGIEDLATRGDLLSRAIVLYLPPLSPDARRREADLWREFEQVRPSICGALYDAVSVALSRVESVQLDSLPRMADFAAWAVAAEPAFGIPQGTFVEAYSGNRATANTTVLEDSPLPEAMMKLLAAQPKPLWMGRASELLEELKQYVSEQTLRDKAWPKAANAISNKLRRLEPSLRAINIDFRESRIGKERTRILTLQKIDNSSSAPSALLVNEREQQIGADDDLPADALMEQADDETLMASDTANSPQWQEDGRVADDADDADDLLPDLSDNAPLNEEEAEFAAHLEYEEQLPRDEAERRARAWFASVS